MYQTVLKKYIKIVSESLYSCHCPSHCRFCFLWHSFFLRPRHIKGDPTDIYIKIQEFFKKVIFVIDTEFCNEGEILLNGFLPYNSKALRRTFISYWFLQAFAFFLSKNNWVQGVLIGQELGSLPSILSLYVFSAFHFSLLFFPWLCSVIFHSMSNPLHFL